MICQTKRSLLTKRMSDVRKISGYLTAISHIAIVEKTQCLEFDGSISC